MCLGLAVQGEVQLTAACKDSARQDFWRTLLGDTEPAAVRFISTSAVWVALKGKPKRLPAALIRRVCSRTAGCWRSEDILRGA